jgi:high-affinity iron transporter
MRRQRHLKSVMAKDSIAGTILAGTISFDVNTSWVQLFLYASYLAIVLGPFTKSPPPKP